MKKWTNTAFVCSFPGMQHTVPLLKDHSPSMSLQRSQEAQEAKQQLHACLLLCSDHTSPTGTPALSIFPRNLPRSDVTHVGEHMWMDGFAQGETPFLEENKRILLAC